MKKLSPKKAIQAMCFWCIVDDGVIGEGSKYDQTTNCNSPECPLWEHRPLNGASKAAIKQEKIAAMSPEQLVKYKKKQDTARERFNKMHTAKTQ